MVNDLKVQKKLTFQHLNNKKAISLTEIKMLTFLYRYLATVSIMFRCYLGFLSYNESK